MEDRILIGSLTCAYFPTTLSCFSIFYIFLFKLVHSLFLNKEDFYVSHFFFNSFFLSSQSIPSHISGLGRWGNLNQTKENKKKLWIIKSHSTTFIHHRHTKSSFVASFFHVTFDCQGLKCVLTNHQLLQNISSIAITFTLSCEST